MGRLRGCATEVCAPGAPAPQGLEPVERGAVRGAPGRGRLLRRRARREDAAVQLELVQRVCGGLAGAGTGARPVRPGRGTRRSAGGCDRVGCRRGRARRRRWRRRLPRRCSAAGPVEAPRSGRSRAIGGDTIYVTETSGNTIKVTLSSATKITKNVGVGKNDVRPGDSSRSRAPRARTARSARRRSATPGASPASARARSSELARAQARDSACVRRQLVVRRRLSGIDSRKDSRLKSCSRAPRSGACHARSRWLAGCVIAACGSAAAARARPAVGASCLGHHPSASTGAAEHRRRPQRHLSHA